MGDRTSTRPILLVIVLCLILEVSKDIEVLWLRNDESLLGENVLNEALGIAILAAALRYLHLGWAALGFRGHRIARDVLVGAVLMGTALTVASASVVVLGFVVLGFVVVVIWYRRTTTERSPRPGPGVGAESGYPTRSSS